MFKDRSLVAILSSTVFVKLENNQRALLRALGECCWVFVVVVLACVYATTAPPINMDASYAGLASMLDGTAYKPYIYRQLSIFLLRLPMAFGVSLGSGVWSIVALSSVTAILATRYLIRSFEQYRRIDWLLAPMTIVGIAALNIAHSWTMLYDMLSVTLAALAFGFMLRGKYGAMLVAFSLACINKETAALITIGFAAVTFGKIPWRKYVGLGAIQVVVWAFVHIAMMIVFAGNGGSQMEMHLDWHWAAITRLWWAVAFYAAIGGALIATVMAHRKQTPWQLNRLFFVLLPIVGVLYITGGVPFEFRVFDEIVPIAIPLLAINGAK
jgi:hypothetical protein